MARLKSKSKKPIGYVGIAMLIVAVATLYLTFHPTIDYSFDGLSPPPGGLNTLSDTTIYVYAKNRGGADGTMNYDLTATGGKFKDAQGQLVDHIPGRMDVKNTEQWHYMQYQFIPDTSANLITISLSARGSSWEQVSPENHTFLQYEKQTGSANPYWLLNNK